MGTYDCLVKGESGLERLTREDVEDFLTGGSSPGEIYEAFPGSFSLGTLRAYKAVLTRKKRENDNSFNSS